ncbi:MAG: hypothetical protein Q4C60_04090 [Eubacteriales bacterium]|nr:hypothetical protein [Eubacteriales bacterium]
MAVKKFPAPEIEAAMELTAVMAVSSIAQKQGRSETDVLKEFLASQTGKMLFDEETKLWCDGPAYVAFEYEREKAQFQKEEMQPYMREIRDESSF